MTIGEVIKVKTSEFYPKGMKFKCEKCLYGDSQNCPGGIAKLCSEYLGWLRRKWKYDMAIGVRKVKTAWDMTSFFEIVDNKDYYEKDKDEQGYDIRHYTYCDKCGYLPNGDGYIDACLSEEHYVALYYQYSEIEIQRMKDDKYYSDMMRDEMDKMEEEMDKYW